MTLTIYKTPGKEVVKMGVNVCKASVLCAAQERVNE